MSLREKSHASLETSAEFSVSGAIKDAIYSRSPRNWEEIFDDDFDDLLQKPRCVAITSLSMSLALPLPYLIVCPLPGSTGSA